MTHTIFIFHLKTYRYLHRVIVGDVFLRIFWQLLKLNSFRKTLDNYIFWIGCLWYKLCNSKVLYISNGCCTEFNIYYFILYLFWFINDSIFSLMMLFESWLSSLKLMFWNLTTFGNRFDIRKLWWNLISGDMILKILGNKEISRRSQNCLQIEFTAYFILKKESLL